MEAVEAFLDGEWDSLSKLFSCEDSDLLLHSNGGNLFSYNVENPLNLGDVGENDATLLLPFNTALHHNTSSFYSVSQESSHSSSTGMESSHLFPRPAAADFANAFDHSSLDFDGTHHNTLMAPAVLPDDLMEEILQLKAQMLRSDHSSDKPIDADDSREEMQLKRKFEDDHNSSQTTKKRRPRASREAQASKRNPQSKKAKKGAQTSNVNDEEMNNAVQSSSTCSSEEDDSQELNGASESTGKAKGSKAPATDPQSLYARKRRERINERLRILQNLVPNGTKVDISTMLEEAVQYVKFLQLQIKLLSSDDMWMYAPIAYNGMDIGLYHKIVPNL